MSSIIFTDKYSSDNSDNSDSINYSSSSGSWWIVSEDKNSYSQCYAEYSIKGEATWVIRPPRYRYNEPAVEKNYSFIGGICLSRLCYGGSMAVILNVARYKEETMYIDFYHIMGKYHYSTKEMCPAYSILFTKVL